MRGSYLPSNSPDLDPIEEFFPEPKALLNAEGATLEMITVKNYMPSLMVYQSRRCERGERERTLSACWVKGTRVLYFV
jgi:hypothetical protein